MNIFELFKMSFVALKSNILRTLLTMLGIVIGISSVIIIISIGQGASKSITDQVSSFGGNLVEVSPVSSKNQSQGLPVSSLTLSDAEAIGNKKLISNIDKSSGFISQGFSVSANGQSKSYSVVGGSPSIFSILNLSIDKGEIFTSDDEAVLAKVAVIGPTVAEEIFGAGTNPIGKQIQIGTKNFRVIGVTKTKGSGGFVNYDKMVIIPLRTGMKLLFGDSKIQSIYVAIADTKFTDNTMNDIGNLLLSQHKIDNPANADFSVNSSKDALGTLNTITNLLTLMLAGIAGISLVVGGIGIMNIMLVTVTERTKEIGLLKAIGAKRADILKQFLIEAVLLTVAGGIIGVIFGTALSFWASKLINIPFVLQPYSILLAVGVSSIVGIIFGLYPASRASKLNPIDALRFE